MVSGQDMSEYGRAPYGARGLKFLDVGQLFLQTGVAPRMGRVD